MRLRGNDYNTPSGTVSISGTNGGKGHYYTVANDGTLSETGTFTVDGYNVVCSSVPESSYPAITAQDTRVNKKITYQPEDRYSMISTVNSGSSPVTNGANDADDYIRIIVPDSISTPYVQFYSTANGETGTEINSAVDDTATTPDTLKSTSGLLLNGSNMSPAIPVENGTGSKTYTVRLPKDALSFTVSNGTDVGDAYPLVENVSVNASDGQLTNVGEQVTTTGFRHAGSTFRVNGTTLAVTLEDVRDGYTVSRQPSITDPLNPRTDNDYIFFTDTQTFGSTGDSGAVYAYFYGDKDGEFKSWPGVKATTASTNVADTTYTDDSGNTVYMFRVPQAGDGKYKYVIFNNGDTSANTRKMTAAIQYHAGYNYTPSTSTKVYGTFAGNGKVYSVSETAKAATPTFAYDTLGTNKYIYIINNGTRNLNSSGLDTGRSVFDDMHVMFYDENKSVIGNDTPGYKPDKITSTTYTNGETVYRIQAPAAAKYFSINNGTKGNTGSYYERTSEIKQLTANGLYRFVDSTVALDHIAESTLPTDAQTKSQKTYLLEMVNKITETDEELPDGETVDIHLATVVTGSGGTIDYIKWLKNSSTDIDGTYLDTTKNKVYVPGSPSSGEKVTSVYVIKQGEYYWKESAPPEGYQINENKYSIDTTKSERTQTIADDEIATPSGKLKISKKLATIKTSNSGENQNFTFNVSLTAPLGWVWTDSIADHLPTVAGTAITSYTIDGLTITLPVTVAATGNDVKVIDYIPDGTYYTITEVPVTDYSSEPIAITKSVGGAAAAPATVMEGTVDGNHSDDDTNSVAYVATNKRDVGTLTLKKKISGDALGTAGVSESTEFTYEVELFVPLGLNVDLEDYIAHPVTGALTTAGTYEYTSTHYKFRMKVSSALSGSKVIGNIPFGVKYTVKELDGSRDGVDYKKSDEVTTQTEISSTNASPVVTIENNYEPRAATSSLTITKSVAGIRPTAMGNPYYKFTVNLSSKVGLEISGTNNTNLTVADITANTNFNVYLRDGETITFSGLNVGTSFVVSEDGYYYATLNSSGVSDSYRISTAYNGDTNVNSVTNTLPEGTTAVTVTNTYPKVGKLSLQKEVVAGNTAESFTYHVKLSRTDSLDLTKYLVSNVTFANATISAEINGVSTSLTAYASNNIEFDVSVVQGTDVEITNIPSGTDYQVTETLTSSQQDNGWKVVNNTASKSGTITVASDQTTVTEPVKFKNIQVGALTISKTVTDGDNAGTPIAANTYFLFEVTLEEPTGVSLNLLSTDDPQNPYEITGLTTSGTNVATISYASGVYTIRIWVQKDGSKTIGGLPYGTKYSVKEIYYDSDTQTYKAITEDPNHPHVTLGTNNGTVENRVTVANLVHTASADNLYRKITFTKKDAKTNDGSDIPLQNAGYYLLKLNSTFETDYANSSTKSTVENAFLSANTYSDLSTYYEASSGTLTTNSSGVITVNDSMISGGLTPGKYFMFEETAPSDYEKDNTLTAEKIITITSTGEPANHNYIKAYTDDRLNGTLKLKKELETGSDISANQSQAFTYTVTLTRASGSENYIDLRQYVTSTVLTGLGATLTKDGNNDNKYSASLVEFTVPVTAGDNPLKSLDLPYGTHYVVTETMPDSTWRKVSPSGNSISGDIGSSNNDVTATFKNIKRGTITLEKTTSGTYKPTTATPANYTFKGTLTGPTGVDLSTYLTIPSSVDYTSSGLGYSSGNNVLTFEATVPTGGTVQFSGVPYGTKYDIYEDDSSFPSWVTSDHGTSNHAASANTGITADTTVAINNEYHSQSLTIHKTVAGDPVPSPDATYNFDVYLTALDGTPSIDLTKFTYYKNSKTAGNELALTSGKLSVSVTGNGSVQILGIPKGTKYYVVEQTGSGYSASIGTDGTNYNINGNRYPASGTQTLSADGNVYFKNTYESTVDLTVTKSVVKTGSYLPSSAATQYTLLVTLTQPQDSPFSNYSSINVNNTMYAVVNNEADTNTTYSTITSGQQFAVKLADGASLSITGLPANTGYSVVESATSKRNAIGYNSDVTNGTLDSSKTVTITNNYEVGTLQLVKELEEGTTDNDEEFSYHVVLTNNDSNVHLTDYLGYQEINNVPYLGSVPLTSATTHTDTTFDFTIDVSAGTAKSISNIPYGTTYTVQEVLTTTGDGNQADAGWQQIGTGTYSPDLTGTETEHKIKQATHTFTAKNVQKGSLSVVKALAGTVPTSDGQEFTLKVKLTAPKGVDLTTYIADLDISHRDNFNTSTTGSGENVRNVYEFTQTFNHNGTTVSPASLGLSNIPYGTDYEVTETGTLPANITKSADVSGTIGTENAAHQVSAHTATITNTYNTGSVTITKATAKQTPDDNRITIPSNGTYKFTVTLVNSGIDLANYTLGCTGTNASIVKLDSPTNTWQVTKTGAGDAAITGIPYGTSYTITEDTVNDGSTASYSKGDGVTWVTLNNNATGTINSDHYSHAFTVTNTYKPTVSLTVSKTVDKDGTYLTAVDNNKEYTMLVTLTQPSSTDAFTAYPVAVSPSNTVMYQVSNNGASDRPDK